MSWACSAMCCAGRHQSAATAGRWAVGGGGGRWAEGGGSPHSARPATPGPRSGPEGEGRTWVVLPSTGGDRARWSDTPNRTNRVQPALTALHPTDCTRPTAPERLHPTNYTRLTAPNRLNPTDCTRPTTSDRLHPADYTRPTAPG